MAGAAHIAFVAGATGYTGRAVVAACCRRAWRTIAHARPDSPALGRWRAVFEGSGAEVDTTSWELPAMTAAFASLQPTLVFALVGTTRQRARGEGVGADAAYRRVDYGLTSLLIDAAMVSGVRPRFVYLSSLGAGSPGRNAYLRARADVEAKLRASDLPWTIARPSFITGPDREEARPLERTMAGIGNAALRLAGALGGRPLRERFRSIDAPALAAALTAAADDPLLAGAVLESAELQALGRPGHPAEKPYR